MLSYGEGAQLSVLMGLPPLIVVPESSAYPGYGKFVMLEGVNHINTCKPLTKEDASYKATREFLEKVITKETSQHITE